MKLTSRKIKYLIREEKSASKMYKSYGLKGISKQESSHASKLTRMLKGGTR
jgi:hypothetical protein